MSHQVASTPRPRTDLSGRRSSIWWMTTRRFFALYPAVSGLQTTKSKPLVRPRDSSSTAVRRRPVAWCSTCRCQAPAAWSCRRRSLRPKNPCRWPTEWLWASSS